MTNPNHGAAHTMYHCSSRPGASHSPRRILSAAIVPASVVLVVGMTEAFAPGALRAQESGRDTATVLAPVVVTATRLPVVENAPTITTTVISGEELRENR